MIAEAVVKIVNFKQSEHPKEPNRYREDQKLFWSYGYQNWTDDEFKDRLRINREGFFFILERIHPYINNKTYVHGTSPNRSA